MTAEPTKATYFSHTLGTTDKGVPKVSIIFMMNDGSAVAEVTIQSDKYIKFLGTKPPYEGVKTLEDVANRVKSLGTVDLYLNQSADFVGYSLTASMFISTKTVIKEKYGKDVKIANVESDDSVIVLHFADGTICRRNLTMKLTKEGKDIYLPNPEKRLRFLQGMGITGDLATYDFNDLIGGTATYLAQSSTFGDWLDVTDFKPATAATTSTYSQADQEALSALDALANQ